MGTATTESPSTVEVAERIGCSYRQLDYWIRVGYLHPDDAQAGTGSRRGWSETEIRVAALIFELERAGFRLEVAAEMARARVTSDTVTFRPGRGVVVDVDWDGGI
jgi:DNA-binding transcriptional MerR regulator